MKYHIFVLLIIITILNSTSCKPKQQILFPSGKDTVETFCDGTYQLLKTPDRTLTLYNCKYQSAIIDRVEQYKKTDYAVAISGTLKTSQIYAVMDVVNNKLYCLISSSDDSFQSEKPFKLEQMLNEGSLVICEESQEFIETLYHLLGTDMNTIYLEALKN